MGDRKVIFYGKGSNLVHISRFYSIGIFVMTVSSVDLAEVCSRLMDISLQLLASVKSLERSLAQVPSSQSNIRS
jgi:hypothetical protein